MDLAWNNLQRLICHKTQPTNSRHPYRWYKYIRWMKVIRQTGIFLCYYFLIILNSFWSSVIVRKVFQRVDMPQKKQQKNESVTQHNHLLNMNYFLVSKSLEQAILQSLHTVTNCWGDLGMVQICYNSFSWIFDLGICLFKCLCGNLSVHFKAMF